MKSSKVFWWAVLVAATLAFGFGFKDCVQGAEQNAALISEVNVVCVGDSFDLIARFGPGEDTVCAATFIEWPAGFAELVSWADIGGCYNINGGVALDACDNPGHIEIDTCSFSKLPFKPQPCDAFRVTYRALAPVEACTFQMNGYGTVAPGCVAQRTCPEMRSPANEPLEVACSDATITIRDCSGPVDVAPSGAPAWGRIKAFYQR